MRVLLLLLKRSFLRFTDGSCGVENALQQSQLSLTMMTVVCYVKEQKTLPVATEPNLGSSHYEADVYSIPPF